MGYPHIYEETPVLTDTALAAALRRILRPLVRVMLARGLRYPAAAEMLRGLYLDVAERDFGLPGKRMTESRLSLLTGLRRGDLKAPRAEVEEAGAGPLPRILARWQAGPPFADASGPLPLSRGDGAAGFAALVAGVSRDLHPRTLLDELLRLGVVGIVEDQVHLRADAFLPAGDPAALVGYFGANLGDHAEAAAENLATAPEPGPFFERALHYNRLTPESAARIEALARDGLAALLARLVQEAQAAQERDRDDPAARTRIRVGAYIYRKESGE